MTEKGMQNTPGVRMKCVTMQTLVMPHLRHQVAVQTRRAGPHAEGPVDRLRPGVLVAHLAARCRQQQHSASRNS